VDELNEDEQAMTGLVREFVDRDVRPVVHDRRAQQHLPSRGHRADEAARYLRPGYRGAVGGAQVSMSCYVPITQELARGWMSLAGAMGGHTVVAKLIGTFGTDEQNVPTCHGWHPVSCGRPWRSPSPAAGLASRPSGR
jgi:alkylation response protein AidB-like acyl-CoA dehydrogenase